MKTRVPPGFLPGSSRVPLRARSSTYPVLLVDVLSQLFQLSVTGYRSSGVLPLLQGDGCSQEAVHHDVGIATDGRGEVCVPVQSQA